MKEKIIPIAAIVVGLIAFLLTGHYLRSQREALELERQKMMAGARKVEVIVAARDISAGVSLGKNDIGIDSFVESALPDDVVRRDEWQQIMGKKLYFGLGTHGVLLWSNIEGAESSAESMLASMVAKGMRAISLPISGASAVSSMVQPNDHVDILGTFSFPSKKVPNTMENCTITVLQDVTILATGQTLAKQGLRRKRIAGSASYNTVTVEVTPRETELLVFAQQAKGSLTLSLRNPADVSYEKTLPEINFQHIETSLPEMNAYRQKTIRHRTN